MLTNSNSHPAPPPFLARLRYYLTPVDGRYEDLGKGSPALNVFRDFTAGLIVAMVAIPLAMGFAMASGLPPEMGIVGGAVAGHHVEKEMKKRLVYEVTVRMEKDNLRRLITFDTPPPLREGDKVEVTGNHIERV